MKRKSLLLLLILFTFVNVESQKISVYSEPQSIKENVRVGAEIIGYIGNLIYVAITNKSSSSELKLSVYDKESLKLVMSIGVNGFGIENHRKELAKASYLKTVVKNNKLYVVWIEKNKFNNRMLLQVFDEKLTEIQSPKIVYELVNSKKSFSKSHLFFVISPNGNMMAAGGEQIAIKGENVTLQYKILNCQLEPINTIQVKLPYSLLTDFGDLTATYKIDDSGELFFNAGIYSDGAFDRKTGHVVGKILQDKGELKYSTLLYKRKMIADFKFDVLEDKMFVYGIYNSTTEADRKSYDEVLKNKYGIFSGIVEKSSLGNLFEIGFNGFEPDKLLFSNISSIKNRKNNLTIEEIGVSEINKRSIVISQYYKSDDGGSLFVLNSYNPDLKCKTNNCNQSSSFYGIYFVLFDSSNEMKGISCYKMNGTRIPDADVEKSIVYDKGEYTYVLIQKNSITAFKINDKSGAVLVSTISNKYGEIDVFTIENEFYFVGAKKFGIKSSDVIFGKFQ